MAKVNVLFVETMDLYKVKVDRNFRPTHPKHLTRSLYTSQHRLALVYAADAKETMGETAMEHVLDVFANVAIVETFVVTGRMSN